MSEKPGTGWLVGLSASLATGLVLLALVVTGPGSAHAAQILVNPGFESGALAPWFADSGTPTVTSSEAHTGLFSVSAFSADAIRQDFAPVATANITEVSLWVKRLGGAFDAGRFFYDDATSSAFLINNVGGSSDWTFFDVTSNLVAGKNLSGLDIFGTTSGPAFFDDFAIVANVEGVPAPASLAMLGFGLAALRLFSKRRAA